MLHRFFQGPLREENELPDSGGSKTAVVEKEKPEEKGKDDAAALRKEIEARDKRIRELETSERHWAEKARGREPEPESDDEPENDEPTREDDDEFDDPAALLEGLTKNGKVTLSKIIDRYVKKAGLITKAQAEALAAEKSADVVAKAEKRLQSDARLVRELGEEINDPKSPLFQRTAQVFQGMVADDPSAANNPAMVRAAGRIAKAELAAEGKTSDKGKRTPIEDDDDDADETERDRRARVNAQQGDRGKGGSFENDDEIGEDTKRVMRLMNIDEKRGIDIIRKERAAKRRSA